MLLPGKGESAFFPVYLFESYPVLERLVDALNVGFRQPGSPFKVTDDDGIVHFLMFPKKDFLIVKKSIYPFVRSHNKVEGHFDYIDEDEIMR